MTTQIICKTTGKGIHSFYLIYERKQFFLFSQDFRKGVQAYFGNGATIDRAMDYSKVHGDHSLMKTMSKIPAHLKYIEKEYGIEILKREKGRRAS